ncbi:MAG: alpha-L-rhamnosidase C-terminal domain-containing protein [Bacteroidales bacterium]|nr:alpha-L-rhamnosidase C-terminal domain-containing protein [Bacteroidales bacterium]
MKQLLILTLSALSILTGKAQNAIPSSGATNDRSITQIDSRTRTYLPPTRILWSNTTGDAAITGAENLVQPGNGQSELVQGKLCHMTNGATGQASILLDFGRELQGGLQIVTGMSASRDIKVRIRYGESASEAMCEIDGKNGATNDHAIRDFNLSLPWLGVAETGNSGFRFVRIDLVGENADLLLKEVRAIFTYRDIPYRGSFRCNDERLNKIWMTGAYTVHLNMQEYLWDGVKRDRLVWVGDMHPEIMTINSVFGYNEVVPKSLDLIRDMTPVPEWMNGISSYSIWWLLIHRDWYYYQGNIKYLKEQQSYLTKLLNHLMTKVGNDGKEQLDGNRFLDWPSSENQKGVDAGLQALMVLAMDAGKELASALEDKELASLCEKTAVKLRSYSPDPNESKQGAALMSLAGLTNPSKADKAILSKGGAKGFSTFYGYYMLQAMAKAGNYQGSLQIIRDYWGAMIDLGATTFWEDFNMEWIPGSSRIDELVPEGKTDIHSAYGNYCYKGFRHSLCHGWASGPTSWLSEHVLGVKVIKPGCKVVRIQPHLGDLSWVEGSFPTPYGDIKIRHEKRPDGTIQSKIEAPAGIEIIK